ncbi:hypothetical protein BpHYR1_050470 [Brachionus plicatilis]|uniref:Uncharacterized protein n=1 Tax=Brachionus plicatilis TaxID=10195 RepID=A0A3M7PG86_BRAPC|nr:hypothetical protein BpHYR1_050470 [Brachionus plicatilis]
MKSNAAKYVLDIPILFVFSQNDQNKNGVESEKNRNFMFIKYLCFYEIRTHCIFYLSGLRVNRQKYGNISSNKGRTQQVTELSENDNYFSNQNNKSIYKQTTPILCDSSESQSSEEGCSNEST